MDRLNCNWVFDIGYFHEQYIAMLPLCPWSHLMAIPWMFVRGWVVVHPCFNCDALLPATTQKERHSAAHVVYVTGRAIFSTTHHHPPQLGTRSWSFDFQLQVPLCCACLVAEKFCNPLLRRQNLFKCQAVKTYLILDRFLSRTSLRLTS
jgi:hypothetical protein